MGNHLKHLSLGILWMIGGVSHDMLMAQIPGFGAPQEEKYPHPESFEELPAMAEPLAWWVITLMVLGGLLLLGLLVWLVIKDRPVRPLPKPHALKTALNKLEKLKNQLDQLEPAEAAHQVSVILREFQALKYEIPAPYRTSEELYDVERGTARTEVKGKFAPLAQVHDRLAFGPQLSRREDVRDLIDDAIKALEV